MRFVIDEGVVELREGASKRGRNQDRDSMNRSKKRRGSYSQSIEDSVRNEQDDVVLDAGVSKIRSLNNTTMTLFHADQNHRRIITSARPPPFKITEEMIGVTVPRKLLRESWVSASSGGGGAEEMSFRQLSNSPGGQSVELSSPFSSNISFRKKMKGIEAVPCLYGLKTSKNHEDFIRY